MLRRKKPYQSWDPAGGNKEGKGFKGTTGTLRTQGFRTRVGGREGRGEVTVGPGLTEETADCKGRTWMIDGK